MTQRVYGKGKAKTSVLSVMDTFISSNASTESILSPSNRENSLNQRESPQNTARERPEKRVNNMHLNNANKKKSKKHQDLELESIIMRGELDYLIEINNCIKKKEEDRNYRSHPLMVTFDKFGAKAESFQEFLGTLEFYLTGNEYPYYTIDNNKMKIIKPLVQDAIQKKSGRNRSLSQTEATHSRSVTSINRSRSDSDSNKLTINTAEICRYPLELRPIRSVDSEESLFSRDGAFSPTGGLVTTDSNDSTSRPLESPTLQLTTYLSGMQVDSEKKPRNRNAIENNTINKVASKVMNQTSSHIFPITEGVNETLDNSMDGNPFSEHFPVVEDGDIVDSDNLKVSSSTACNFGSIATATTAQPSFGLSLSPIKPLIEDNTHSAGIAFRSKIPSHHNIGSIATKCNQIFDDSVAAMPFSHSHSNSNRLSRAATMPIMSSQIGSITPGGTRPMSLSQNDIPQFQTPQSNNMLVVSGVHGYDWGSTEQAHHIECSRLLKKLEELLDNKRRTNGIVRHQSDLSHQFTKRDSLTPSRARSHSSVECSNSGSFETALSMDLTTEIHDEHTNEDIQLHDHEVRKLEKSKRKWQRRISLFQSACKKSTNALDMSVSHNIQSDHSEIDMNSSAIQNNNVSFDAYHELITGVSPASNSPVVHSKFYTSRNYRARKSTSSSFSISVFSPNCTDNSMQHDGSEDMNESDILNTSNHILSDDITWLDLNQNLNRSALDTRASIIDVHQINKNIQHNLNESTFRAIVIGGTYQHCFQDSCPVIAPPSTFDKRVISIALSVAGSLDPSKSSLTLKLFIPKDNNFKVINLGSEWKWLRASPSGFLVVKDSFEKAKNPITYYLSQHPLSWDHKERSKIASSHMDRLIMPCGDNSHENSFIGQSGDDMHGMITTNEADVSLDSIRSVDGIEDVSEDTLEKLSSDWNWNNLSIVSLILPFLVDYKIQDKNINDSVSYFLVNKTWALASYRHLALHRSKNENMQSVDYSMWARFTKRYESGKFLSEGACKRVYRVSRPVCAIAPLRFDSKNPSVSSNSSGYDAVSVSDVIDLKSRGIEEAISKELEIAMICSSLSTLRICPNLVQIYSIFQSPYGVVEKLWESKSVPNRQTKNNHRHIDIPKENFLPKGKLYQFVRMEFCSGGDLDGYVSKMKLIEIESVRKIIFQMMFSLYACREQIALRHFDIKLLNFLVTTVDSLIPQPEVSNSNIISRNPLSSPMGSAFSRPSVSRPSSMSLIYGFGEYKYNLTLASSNCDFVKLTDFGTSLVGAGGLGDPITEFQFTTLENTPIEYFLLGSDARQAYSADTFCLGLSVLHLVMGHLPYEEILKDVKCPEYLSSQLSKLWLKATVDSPYYVIGEVIRTVESDDGYPGMVLCDTLYRYLVLFGVPAEFLENNCCPYTDNKVWKILLESLGIVDSFTKKRRERASSCILQYQKDKIAWSLESGQEAIMQGCRERLKLLDPLLGKRFVEMLVHFDPSRRYTMHEVLQHRIFHCFRDFQSEGYRNSHNSNKTPSISFLHYYRPESKDADSLPIL